MADVRPPTPAAHPTDEFIVAYLTTGLTETERRDVDEHVRACDRCVQALAVAQRRIAIEAEIVAPVPVSLQERVAAVTADSVPSVRDALRTWTSAVSARLSAFLRLPVLVPAAVAAVVLLAIATQQMWLGPQVQREMSRSIGRRETLRVTANEAVVRVQPVPQGAALASLKRGTRVEVVGDKGDWYQVLLPDGKEGWIDRSAFE